MRRFVTGSVVRWLAAAALVGVFLLDSGSSSQAKLSRCPGAVHGDVDTAQIRVAGLSCAGAQRAMGDRAHAMRRRCDYRHCRVFGLVCRAVNYRASTIVVLYREACHGGARRLYFDVVA